MRAALGSYFCTASSSTSFAIAPDPVLTSTDPSAGIAPTLFLIKDALIQAVVIDLPEIISEESRAKNMLSSSSLYMATRQMNGGGTADDLAMQHAVEEYVSSKGLPPFADRAELRAMLVETVSRCSADVSKLISLIEHLMALLYQQLKHAALAENGDGRSISKKRNELDQLRRLTEPAITSLEQMLAGNLLVLREPSNGMSGDGFQRTSFELIIRRVKEIFSSLSS